jgi:hypothetical protein
VRTRRLVELGVAVPDEGEQVRLLREAAALGGNLTAAAMATVLLSRKLTAGGA